jgi:anti-anti-sigma factor
LEIAMADARYCLRGVVDLANAAEIRADLSRMISSSDAHLLVDCTQLTFIDSTGIAVLLEANQRLEAAGRHMLVFNVQDGPRRTFDGLGLADLLRYDRKQVEAETDRPSDVHSAEVKEAAGIVSRQTGCRIEEALAMMWERADDAGASLDDIANAVLHHSLRFDRQDKSA